VASTFFKLLAPEKSSVFSPDCDKFMINPSGAPFCSSFQA